MKPGASGSDHRVETRAVLEPALPWKLAVVAFSENGKIQGLPIIFANRLPGTYIF